jgi:hypothetical protein
MLEKENIQELQNTCSWSITSESENLFLNLSLEKNELQMISTSFTDLNSPASKPPASQPTTSFSEIYQATNINAVL